MPFHQSGDIRYFTFDSLIGSGLHHAVFTRRGGLSPEPWASLNVGGLVGDSAKNVLENRQRSFQAVGRDPASMYDVWQVHGTEVVCTDRPRPLDKPHHRADSILTNQSGVTLFMRFADCVPILLYDQRRGVVGLAHAGWLGTVNKVTESAIQRMQTQYGSRPEDIRAGIGPSICADHYEVGSEVVSQVRHAFGADSSAVLSPGHGEETSKAHFNLWTANRIILENAGVREVEVSGLCTACHIEDWYSHRGEKGKTGRFGVLIGLDG